MVSTVIRLQLGTSTAAKLLKEVASKTNDAAGDGTTTAVVLAQAMLKEGFKAVTMGVNSIGIRLGMEEAARHVIEALKKMAKPIKNREEIMQVASVAAESEEIGNIIADTLEKVGKDGVVTVEESQKFGVESEVVKGMQFDRGYVSPYMVTNAERMEAVLEIFSFTDVKNGMSGIFEPVNARGQGQGWPGRCLRPGKRGCWRR